MIKFHTKTSEAIRPVQTAVNVLILTLFTMLLGYNRKQVSNDFLDSSFDFEKKLSLTSLIV